jgi:hypothetical protein
MACDAGLYGPFTGNLWPKYEPVSQDKIGDHMGVFAAKTAEQVHEYLLRRSVQRHIAGTWFPADPKAWYGPENATHIVVGTVGLWGEMAEHKKGYRGQFGKITSLDRAFSPSGLDDDAILVDLRKYYGVK